MTLPKIALVNQPWNPAVPPVTAGSIAIWTYEVARRLAEDCDVTVLSRSWPGESPDRHADRVRYLRCSNWPTPFSRIGRLLLRAAGRARDVPDVALRGYYSAYHRRVGRVVARMQPDVVHVQNLGQAVTAVRHACPSVRTVLHMHCEWLSQLPRSLVVDWVRASDLILGCSDFITRKIAAAWPEHAQRCATLYNGVDTERFAPEGPSRCFGTESDEIVLFVGRLSPEKGLHVLIRCFDAVLGRRPRARLVVAGPESVTPLAYLVALSDDRHVRQLSEFYTGGYLNRLKSMVDGRLRDRVHFIGPVSHDELPDLYRGADVLVNPSLSESFGMTVLEAMACGVPAVVTSVGGMPEIVGSGRLGLMVAPGSAEPLADAIVALLEDRERRRSLGVSAAAYVHGRFSWQRIAADARELYQVHRTEEVHR